MYNIIPLILILVSLIIIITIVVRKFSILANVNIESIQSEREAIFKEQIIGNRLKRTFFKHYAKIANMIKPVFTAIGSFFSWGYRRLVEFKENYNKEENILADETVAVAKLMSEAEESVREEKFEEAEKKYIEIIGLDSKNIKAFRGLGELYYDRKNYPEARQTLEHILKLCENTSGNEADGAGGCGESMNSLLAGTYYELCLVAKGQEDNAGALVNINKALKIEPNNPRYLDTKFEISIINKDKAEAFDAYERMKEVNPENQKLADFQQKINEL